MKNLEVRINELVKSIEVTSDAAGKKVLKARQQRLQKELEAQLIQSLQQA